MSTVTTTTVKTEPTTDTLTIGATGDSVAISGDSLNLNTLQDAGGNTIFVSNGSGTITSTGLPGAMTLISSQTASNQTSIAFTSGLDSTYEIYMFRFINIHALVATDGKFEFQTSTDGGSSYGVTATTSYFVSENNEADTWSDLAYVTSGDLAQSTNYQRLMQAMDLTADECGGGILQIFNPSSTTYVKLFYSRCQDYNQGNSAEDCYSAGYFNTTTALNAIQFRMSAGNLDGTIAMYGISTS